MIKIVFTLITFFFIPLTYGQNNPQTLLWKVTKKGNKHHSYLFGTFHEVNPAFFNTLSNAVKKLHESDILFVENQANTIQKHAVSEKSAWNFEKWQTILTDEQHAIFQEFVQKIADTSCYSQSPFELLLGITRNYMQTLCQKDIGFSELMDSHIEKLALKDNKKVYSLDINHPTLISNISKKTSEQQDSLYAVNCISGMRSTLNRDLSGCEFITSYQNLNIDYKLDTVLNPNSFDNPLLIERNKGWIVILDKAFTSDNCFVAVGFRHLCYQQGLIQQLRKIGYEITPISGRF